MAISLKDSKEFLNATKTASETGSSVTIGDNWEGFVGVLKASSVGGTTPTFDVKFEHSHNGTDWFDLASFTQITADSSEAIAISSDVMEFVRYDLVVGGTTPTADLELNFVYDNRQKIG